jgi:hypothetical protein
VEAALAAIVDEDSAISTGIDGGGTQVQPRRRGRVEVRRGSER